jgi:hypothetical protein
MNISTDLDETLSFVKAKYVDLTDCWLLLHNIIYLLCTWYLFT